MSTPQFKNINELTGYLQNLENRLGALEFENQELRTALANEKKSLQTNIQDHNLEMRSMMERMGNENAAARQAFRFIPDSGLFSRSFIQRAFTVWGHYIVAQLIISGVILVFYLVVMVLIVGVSVIGK
jgi:hypothetical protein